MQVGQKGGDWAPNECAVTRRHEFAGGQVGQFDEAARIHGYDRRWAGLNQRFQFFLPDQGQSAVANQFRDEQPAARKR